MGVGVKNLKRKRSRRTGIARICFHEFCTRFLLGSFAHVHCVRAGLLRELLLVVRDAGGRGYGYASVRPPSTVLFGTLTNGAVLV